MIDPVQAAKNTAITGADDRLALSQKPAEKSRLIVGIPRHRDPRAKAFLERGVWVSKLKAVRRLISDGWIVDLSGKRRCLPLRQVVRSMDQTAIGEDEHDLVSVFLHGRSFVYVP